MRRSRRSTSWKAPHRLRRALTGRIVAKGDQPEAVSLPFGIIEVKKPDSGAPTGGNPLDTTAVEAKMAIPSLLTWIKKEDDFLRDRVNRSQVGAFEPVTIQAGPRQILKGRWSSVFFSNHMVCFVWIIHICFMDETVFTSSLRTLLNLTP